MPMMAFEDEALQQRAHDDLTKRARGGIVVYLVAWLAIMMPHDIHLNHPRFFYINSAILVILMSLRLAHYYFHRRQPQLPLKIAHNWLVWTVLAGALHWGLMSGWCLSQQSFASLEALLIATGATFGITGSTSLGISWRIRMLFPAFIFFPGIAALLMRASTADFSFAIMGGLALFYIVWTAKTASRDYWRAITNESLAARRAREMEQLSITDQLTQLKNRSYFDQRFNEEWKRGNRKSLPLSLLMLDLDHFKLLNDNHGHVFGDYCLQQVGQVLDSSILRETDVVARYGGEEFVILMPDTSAIEAAAVAEKLRLAIAAIDVRHDDEPVALTCSIGGASTYPNRLEDHEKLLKQADEALYNAKRGGRNQYQASILPSAHRTLNQAPD